MKLGDAGYDLDEGRGVAAPEAPAAPTLGGDFGKGLENAFTGIRGGFNRTAASMKNAVGLDGAEQNAAADEAAQQIAENQPSIRSWGDVHGVGDAAHWLAGAAGGVVPILAGGALGGLVRGTAGAMAGSGAAMLPGELGGQIDRAHADPANANLSEGQILQAAIPTALASTAVNSIVPGGGMAGTVAAKGLRGMGQRIATDAATQGVAGYGSEAIRQAGDRRLNPNRPWDTAAMQEQGEEGVAAGTAFGAAHSLGHVMASPKELYRGAVDSAKGMVPDRFKKPPADAAAPAEGDGTPPAGPTPPGDIIDSLGKIYDATKTKASDFLKKVAEGKETATDINDPTTTPEAAVAKDAAVREEAAHGWVKDLADRAISPEHRAQVAEAAKNLKDAANQTIVAGIKRASDAASDANKSIADFADKVSNSKVGQAFKDGRDEAKLKKTSARREPGDMEMGEEGTPTGGYKALKGPKKSEDYSDTNDAIVEKITPILKDYAPHLLHGNPTAIKRFGNAVRQVATQIADGDHPSSEIIAALSEVTGGHAHKVLRSVAEVVGGKDTDYAHYLKQIESIRDQESGHDGVVATMRKHLKPELQKHISDRQLRQEAGALDQWASTTVGASTRKGFFPETESAKAREKLVHDTVNDHLAQRYGDKADHVLDAVQRNMQKQRAAFDMTQEDRADITEKDKPQETVTHLYGGKHDAMLLHPDHDPGKSGHKGAATQKMERAKTDFPQSQIHLLSVEELGHDHPHVLKQLGRLIKDGEKAGLSYSEAYKTAQEEIHKYVVVGTETAKHITQLSEDQLNGMKLDAHEHSKSASRVQVSPGVALDAVKIVRAMREKLKGEHDAVEPSNDLLKTKRTFMEGMAAVQEHFGKAVEVPDSVVVDYAGKKPITWGELKKASGRSEADKEYDADTSKLEQLRKQHMATTERMKAAVDGEGTVSAKEFEAAKKERAAIREKARDIHEKREFALARDQLKEERTPAHREDDLNKRALLAKQLESTTMEQARRDVLQKRIDAIDRRLEGDKDKEDRTAEAREARMDEIKAELDGLDAKKDPGRSRRLTNEWNELDKQREDMSEHGTRKGQSNVKTEADPFGNVHEALGGKGSASARGKGMDTELTNVTGDNSGQIRINSSGNSRANDVQGRRRPAQHAEGATELSRPKREPEAPSVVKFDEEKNAERVKRMLEAGGEPPSPKVRAAKAAALKEKAASGDAGLLEELSTSKNAKGLQRAVSELLKDKKPNEHTVAAIDAANERLDHLVQNPDTGYGMLTKKYSLMSTEIHKDLERPGFAATHDSPHKFENFDWRKHAMTGEGAMVKGAGTYLSTADAVHAYYKKGMTQRATERAAALDERMKALVAEHVAGKAAYNEAVRAGQNSLANKHAARANEIIAEVHRLREEHATVSPTYHVSVDIPPERLLDWDKETSYSQPEVFDKISKVFEEHGGFADPLGTGESLYRSMSELLGGDRRASDALQAAGIDGHEYAAAAGKDKTAPNYVIYNDSKITTNYVHHSMQDARGTDPTAQGPINRQETYDYFHRVLRDTVRIAWDKMTHAGEFERVFGKDGSFEDVVRLSVHALNPLTHAYHEALHAFFKKLNTTGQGKIAGVLERAASSASVTAQLRNLLKDHPEALKQLSDPEERAAYMYQYWSMRDAKGNRMLNLGPETQNVFHKIADFIRSILGTWSNDKRALHIMEYFHSGEYAKEMGNPDAVWQSTMTEGRNRAIETMKAMTQPVREMGESVFGAGAEALRDTGIPALQRIADFTKLKTTSEGTDPGWITASRAETAARMNKLAGNLRGISNDDIKEGFNALLAARKPATADAQKAADLMRAHLDEQFHYLRDAGVKVNDLGVGKDYVPHQFDTSYIASHQRQFLNMLEKYVQRGDIKAGYPKELMQKLMVTDGAEFNVETGKPGMQHLKPRELKFLEPADIAPFLRNNPWEVLRSYTQQAARRAEWARRVGDDGRGLREMFQQAKEQGASRRQLEQADRYIKAVTGTLGDDIPPEARRLFGNLMVYQNVRLLPLGIFSSMPDPLGMMVRGGTISDAFKAYKRGFSGLIKNFQNPTKLKSDEMTEIAHLMGTIDNAVLAHQIGSSYSQGMVGDMGRKVNDWFFRVNLMERFNADMRIAGTEAALNFLGKHKDGDHSAHSMRYLTELGLKPGDVQMMTDPHTGTVRPKLTMDDGLSLEHAAQMKAAVNRWVDGAVLRPDAADSAIWMNDPRFALISHLKKFTMSFHETILKRMVHEAKNGNFTPVMALASYVPVMIAADLAKGLIQGGGQQPSWKQDWDWMDYVESGMERSSLYGNTQFGVDAFKSIRHGGSGFDALPGPMIEQLLDSAKVIGGRERFSQLAIASMPANALYAWTLHGNASDPRSAE